MKIERGGGEDDEENNGSLYQTAHEDSTDETDLDATIKDMSSSIRIRRNLREKRIILI